MTIISLPDVKINREARNQKKIIDTIGLVCKLWANKVQKCTKSLLSKNATSGLHKILQDCQY